MADEAVKTPLERIAELLVAHGVGFLVIDLDDLITIKRHIGRPKDRESLLQLLAIKRIQEEGG